jgi:erythromycin esterase-like protein
MGSKTLTVKGKRYREYFTLDQTRAGIMDDGVIDALIALGNDGDKAALDAVIAALFLREVELRTEFYAALVLLMLNVETTQDPMIKRYLRRFPHFGRWYNEMRDEMMAEDAVDRGA